MATVASVAIRRANAEAAIKAAVSALADKHGAEMVDETYPVRDIELRRVMDLESVAANLTAITDKLPGSKKKAEAAKAEPKAEEAETTAAEETAPTPKAKNAPASKKKG